MVPETHLQVLSIILNQLKSQNLDWAITGSLCFALQGVPVEVHDIDLQTDIESAQQVEQLLSAWKVSPLALRQSDVMRSWCGLFKIEEIEVEVIGGVQKKTPNGSWGAPIRPSTYRRWVEQRQMRVPVLDLHYELLAYRAMGRENKASLLETWLAEHPNY